MNRIGSVRRDASPVDDNRAILHDPSDALDDGVTWKTLSE